MLILSKLLHPSVNIYFDLFTLSRVQIISVSPDICDKYLNSTCGKKAASGILQNEHLFDCSKIHHLQYMLLGMIVHCCGKQAM